MERSLPPAPWLDVVKTVLAGLLGVTLFLASIHALE